MRRLLAVGFIWACCAAAWAILASTLLVRSGSTSGELLREVHALWGPPLEQAPPVATATETHPERKKEQKFDEKEKRYYEVEHAVQVTTTRNLPLEETRAAVHLALEQRRKGLVWFPTYGVAFRGRYSFRNDSGQARRVDVAFPLQRDVVYDGFALSDSAGAPLEVTFDGGKALFTQRLGPGESLSFDVAYRARGTERWGYGSSGGGLGPEVGRARNFEMKVTADFAGVDFPAGSLSPTSHGPAAGGWAGTWAFTQIVATKPLGIVLPEKLNPGPLASKITFFAPVSLLFFFFVTGVLLAASGRSIHPMNYFLLACAFFAFHLLFAYLIDQIAVGAAFAAASIVSVFLVVTYARLFVGWRTALVQMGLSQVVYLVLFSFTFFWKGFTGLAITVGAIATLFVIMQITGRLEWSRALSPGDGARSTG
jgi:inner membrane protein CreD